MAAMKALSEDFLRKYPNMKITPVALLKLEQLRDVGGAQCIYSHCLRN